MSAVIRTDAPSTKLGALHPSSATACVQIDMILNAPMIEYEGPWKKPFVFIVLWVSIEVPTLNLYLALPNSLASASRYPRARGGLSAETKELKSAMVMLRSKESKNLAQSSESAMDHLPWCVANSLNKVCSSVTSIVSW